MFAAVGGREQGSKTQGNGALPARDTNLDASSRDGELLVFRSTDLAPALKNLAA